MTCSNCGAPLRALKMLPKQPERTETHAAVSHRPKSKKRDDRRSDYRHEKPKKRRKSKSFGRRVMSEFWDVVEDVVDDIFD